MKFLKYLDQRIHIEFERDELLILHAALNEVCNGIDLFEFETRLGADIEEVKKILDSIDEIVDLNIEGENE